MCLLLFPLIMSKAVHSTKSLFPHITFGELPIFSVIMTWTVRNDITRIRSRILIEFSHYTVKYRKETCMRSNLCDFSFVGQAHHSVCSINCLQKHAIAGEYSLLRREEGGNKRYESACYVESGFIRFPVRSRKHFLA